MAVQFGLPPSGQHRAIGAGRGLRALPEAQGFFAETRLGWVPFWLEHMDLWYKRHIGWAESSSASSR